MKQISSLFLLLTIVSCVSEPVHETPAIVVSTKIVPTNTSLPLTPIPITTPSITPTIEPPCDPFAVDFCITDGHFILQRPIQPPGNDRVDPAYRYGATANGTRDPHHGVEFPNASGTPVYAASDGQVIFAGQDDEAIYSPWPDFYGNLVVIKHGNDLSTLYAHLSKINVETNQNILAGTKIGEVGWTGGAIGSHLHFEVRRGNVEDYFATQNPELWLVPARDPNGNLYGTLAITVVDANGNLIKIANLTIGHYSDPSQSPLKTYYARPYASDMLNGKENAVLGELSAGHYRIAVETNGQILERWAEVQSGKLTQVVFVAK